MNELERNGIGFCSLQESIDTTTSGGKLVFHIFGALAEFERNLIRDRTKAGLNAARARGRKGGRPKALDEEQRTLAVDLYEQRKHTVDEICRRLGISKPTLYGYVREKGA
jgi:DNA invertase Pin-like site-specific DNA recombinase